MTRITISGGVYHEECIWPCWNRVYGSGGRAAAALLEHVEDITLQTYARTNTVKWFKSQSADHSGIDFVPVDTGELISFRYVHSLSIPSVYPSQHRIRANGPIEVADDTVLRFGMMEGSARVKAGRCVYDPQSAFRPEPFDENGSTAQHLAVIANVSEVKALGRKDTPAEAAQALLDQNAQIVIVKMGVAGALVVDHSGETRIPAFVTNPVFTIGSGDVFSALFASAWGVHGKDPVEAAHFASRGVAEYVRSMVLPIPAKAAPGLPPLEEARAVDGRVYLAGPFFTLGQRWLVDEVCSILHQFGLEVFSPIHDVGPGPANEVAPADLAGLDSCDAVLAIVDGLDSGTMFEIGYARAKDKPVYALAQTASEADLKMVSGSGCRVFTDFVTAMHHVVWRA